MGLKDKVVRALALRWLRGKVEDLRGKKSESGMGKVLRALDGWKLVIAVLGIFSCGVYDAYHNGHTGQFLASVLTTIGWLPPGEWTGEAMTKAVLGAVAILGLVGKLIKAQQQRMAGSSMSGLLSTEGYLKAEMGRLSLPKDSVLVDPAKQIKP
jgi:hypothetical protein